MRYLQFIKFLRDFTQGIKKNCEDCVSQFNLFNRLAGAVCTGNIPQIKTKGGALLGLAETINDPGGPSYRICQFLLNLPYTCIYRRITIKDIKYIM